MIEFKVLLLILLIHFLGDFALQTGEQAKRKHASLSYLMYHVLTYSTVWFLILCAWTGNMWYSFLFTTITLVTHFIIDLITSNIGHSFWEKKDYHNGFVVVGADQVLHYIQLIVTYMYFFPIT